MGYCQRCGGYCADNYTFCKRCYIALGSPYGTSISKGHECRKCGKTIYGRYNYCPDCAKRLGFLKKVIYNTEKSNAVTANERKNRRRNY